MFRRRRRDGKDRDAPEPAGADSLAADDELAEEDFGDAGADLTDDYADDEFAEYAEPDADGYAAVGAPAAGQDGLDGNEGLDGHEGLDGDEHEDGEEGEPAAARPRRDDLGDPETWTRLRDSATATPAMQRSEGPWDSESDYPQSERIDFGSLLVPVREGFDVQVFMSEDEGISIAVVSGESGLQLQPFAAPRSSGLWHEVLPEIADEVAKAGGRSRQQEGPFGPELYAVVVPQGAGDFEIPEQPLRFLGADGPRWFLRGLISGPAASNAELARPLEDIFANVVVVRGDHAEPQRKPLDIRLPDEARQVLESQLEEQQASQDANGFNPFERGPEITETR